MLPKTVSAPNHLGKRLDPPPPKRAMPKCRGLQFKRVFPNMPDLVSLGFFCLSVMDNIYMKTSGSLSRMRYQKNCKKLKNILSCSQTKSNAFTV